MSRRKCASAVLAAVILLSSLTGCGTPDDDSEGMELSVALQGAPTTLDPIRAESCAEKTAVEHLYENLMRPGCDSSGGSVALPGMAKSYDWEKNYDGTVTYTFRLRNAKWSDGTAVTAQDFVYAWRRLADPVSRSPQAEILSIVAGYEHVRSTGDVTALQVEAKNDTTLSVTLSGVCEWFLTDVCTDTATMPLRQDAVQALKEAALEKNRQAEAKGETGTATWCSNGAALVTNGPYTVTEQSGGALELTASETYGGTAEGPSVIRLQFASTAEEGWALYEAKQADVVSPLPEEQLSALAEKEDWTPRWELNTAAVLFNTASDTFSDPLVRRALSRSLERTVLAGLAGAAARPAEGLVPPLVPGEGEEDFRTAGGALVNCVSEEYEAECVEARALLAEAGYDSGRALGTVECLYVNQGSTAAVARAAAQMWQDALKLRLELVSVTARELKTALDSGDYTLAIGSVTGYANDAESFLSPWRSDSENNVAGYRNSAYDTLMKIISSASDETARYGCLHDAESLLLEECPLTPLYFTGTDWEAREGLLGICRDARGWFCFSDTVREAES